MNEAEAKAWLADTLDVSRETMEVLEAFIDYLKREAQSQNLIAKSTLDIVWSRHIVDSAQLLAHLPQETDGTLKWLDLGSGAGFPGLVIGMLTGHQVTLVESRARRIEYLQRAVEMLDLEESVTVAGMSLEKFETAKFDVVSARAFAPLPKLLTLAERFSTENTHWLLPKGQNAARELSEAQKQIEWRGRLKFHVKQSLTDEDAQILAGQLLSRKPGKRRKRS